MSSVRHVREVRTLYRQILRLHRRLPTHFRAVGDQYAKDEFHRHKKAGAAEVQTFMTEWKNYAKMLQEQLAQESSPVGQALPPEKVENLTDEQLGQLFELQQETTKPISEELQDLIEDDKKR
ncbi:SDHAF3 [Branchiostoma lanceolatum]|uniref:Succinate dehydrogenase assembly factor 3 n=1 Tax=Branchiostoma lanceolatum TaxID=7740 RepID=A0A8K0ECH4_BRALA|nr:SDHAF3 [Branchiostoma lanceolatum]